MPSATTAESTTAIEPSTTANGPSDESVAAGPSVDESSAAGSSSTDEPSTNAADEPYTNAADKFDIPSATGDVVGTHVGPSEPSSITENFVGGDSPIVVPAEVSAKKTTSAGQMPQSGLP